MRSKAVAIVTLALSAFLFACSGEKAPHERLAGVWDVDDKASWEYQRPGEAYAPTVAELQRDISLEFDIKEQTCLVRNAFGSLLLRYRVVSEEKDKVTLVIGENTYVLEFKAENRLLFSLPAGGIESCFIWAKGDASAEAETRRMAEAESRLAAIMKLHTQNVSSRTEQFLRNALVAPGERVARADTFQFYVTEVNTVDDGQPKGAEQAMNDAAEFLNVMLRDFVSNNHLRYARVYTRKGTACLSSDINALQLSDMQRKLIQNVIKTGNPGPITLTSYGGEFLFELYVPIFKPIAGDEKDAIGVLVIARPMLPLPDECFNSTVSLPEGSLHFIRYTGQNYQTVGGSGVKREFQSFDTNDANELPFARRDSLVGDGEVCSQASPGPATNSWILFETSCAFPPVK